MNFHCSVIILRVNQRLAMRIEIEFEKELRVTYKEIIEANMSGYSLGVMGR